MPQITSHTGKAFLKEGLARSLEFGSHIVCERKYAKINLHCVPLPISESPQGNSPMATQRQTIP